MSRKVLVTLISVCVLIVGIPGAYLTLAWRDTNPLEMQLGHMTLLPGKMGTLSLTVRNRSHFPVEFQGATLWHPTDHDRKPMHSFNMDSIPFIRHSLRPGQSITIPSTTHRPDELVEVDSFECTYDWIPLGRTNVVRAHNWLLDEVGLGLRRYRDVVYGQETIDNPSFTKSTGKTVLEVED